MRIFDQFLGCLGTVILLGTDSTAANSKAGSVPVKFVVEAPCLQHTSWETRRIVPDVLRQKYYLISATSGYRNAGKPLVYFESLSIFFWIFFASEALGNSFR